MKRFVMGSNDPDYEIVENDWHHKYEESNIVCTCDKRTPCQTPEEDKEYGSGCLCFCHSERIED